MSTSEIAITEQIQRMAEKYNMLLTYQMGAHQGWSIEIALDLLVNQVYKI